MCSENFTTDIYPSTMATDQLQGRHACMCYTRMVLSYFSRREGGTTPTNERRGAGCAWEIAGPQ